MKTPTKHSDEVPIATECLGSSAKNDSKSADASELMVADMLSQMVRPGSQCYLNPSIEACLARVLYFLYCAFGFLYFCVACFSLFRILQEEDFRKSGNSIMDRMRELGSKMDALEESE